MTHKPLYAVVPVEATPEMMAAAEPPYLRDGNDEVLISQWLDEYRRIYTAMISASPPHEMIAVSRDVIDRAVKSGLLAVQNCHGCAMEHHGMDYSEQGPPGWLADCEADLIALRTALETTNG